MRFSTDPEMDAALAADDEKLGALGAYVGAVGARGAAEAERAAVVKYLRAWAAHCPEDSATQHAMLNASRDIEMGEHL